MLGQREGGRARRVAVGRELHALSELDVPGCGAADEKTPIRREDGPLAGGQRGDVEAERRCWIVLHENTPDVVGLDEQGASVGIELRAETVVDAVVEGLVDLAAGRRGTRGRAEVADRRIGQRRADEVLPRVVCPQRGLDGDLVDDLAQGVGVEGLQLGVAHRALANDLPGQPISILVDQLGVGVEDGCRAQDRAQRALARSGRDVGARLAAAPKHPCEVPLRPGQGVGLVIVDGHAAGGSVDEVTGGPPGVAFARHAQYLRPCEPGSVVTLVDVRVEHALGHEDVELVREHEPDTVI